jgi:hypothetical protein
MKDKQADIPSERQIHRHTLTGRLTKPCAKTNRGYRHTGKTITFTNEIDRQMNILSGGQANE